MPDLHELDHFDQGLPPMDLLPAAEIRRRGDRMRRRRTGLTSGAAVLAVALAVGTPILLRSGDDGSDVSPAPRPSQTVAPIAPPHGWLTEFFDFPIESTFPTPFERTERPDGSELTPTCGPWFSGEFANEQVVSYRGESENQDQRWMILFKDQQAAEDSMAEARQSVAMCPADGIPGPPGGGVTQVYSEVPVDLHNEDSFAWAQQVRHDDGLLSDLTYVQIARSGNALYIESSYTSAGGPDVIASVQKLLTRRSADPLAVLCVYAADPCLDPYAPPGPPVNVPGTPISTKITASP